MSSSHVPVDALNICVVVPMENSVTARPESMAPMRSGTSSRRVASRGRPSRTWANTWKTVFNGMNWMPVRANISARGTRSNAASIIPSVRASR